MVVVVGFAFTAALWAGEDEQALTSSPASPAAASTLQARGCRNVVRFLPDFAIAERRSYEGQAREWWQAADIRAGAPARDAGDRQAEGVPEAVPAAAADPL